MTRRGTYERRFQHTRMNIRHGAGRGRALMIGGIAFLGVVTAALASWLVEQVTAAEEQQTVTLRAEIHRLESEVARLAGEPESAHHGQLFTRPVDD